MRGRTLLTIGLAMIVYLLVASFAGATSISSYTQSGITLNNAPDYDWYHGCSPTSAGMMMGYYDINGYDGLSYDNLVPGIAVLNTFNTPGGADETIDSLAGFMETTTNGSTSFWNFENGDKLYASDAEKYMDPNGILLKESSGMYGIMEYIQYAGYEVSSLYNQYTDNLGLTYGFSLADFQNEINNNRVVMLHVEGHSMFGYGYDDDTIYLHDTWTSGDDHTMTWGGDYCGLDMWGVTAFELTGGMPIPQIPEPGTFILFGTALFAIIRRRKNK